MQMLRQILTVGALAAVSATAGAQSTPSVAATIDRAVAAYGKAATSRATFEQTVTNPLTGGTAVARGEFQQQRPGRLAIRFTDPDGDRIVSDGAWLWIYLPSTAPGQVIKRPATNGSTPLDITSQFLDEPRSKYDITDAGRESAGGDASRVLALVPKPGTDSPFTRAKVWISDRDALIRQFEIVEPNGVTRRVRLTSLTLGAPVERGAFTFAVPKGVKVVEGK
jgi:outer membrane lipoprotein carrier protein